jgi:hypothetical protein
MYGFNQPTLIQNLANNREYTTNNQNREHSANTTQPIKKSTYGKPIHKIGQYSANSRGIGPTTKQGYTAK